MQLFELAKRQLRFIHGTLEAVKKNPDGGDRLYPCIGVPLRKIKGTVTKEHMDSSTDTPCGIDIPQYKAEGQEERGADFALQGIEDFTYSVIYMAHNPIRRSQTPAGPNATDIYIAKDEGAEGCSKLYFENFRPKDYHVSKVGDEIDRIETAMFANWREKPANPQQMVKVFGSKEERERVEHLFVCMAQACGLSKEEMEGAFDHAPNDHTTVLDRDFLTAMAHAEKTVEFNTISRRRA